MRVAKSVKGKPGVFINKEKIEFDLRHHERSALSKLRVGMKLRNHKGEYEITHIDVDRLVCKIRYNDAFEVTYTDGFQYMQIIEDNIQAVCDDWKKLVAATDISDFSKYKGQSIKIKVPRRSDDLYRVGWYALDCPQCKKWSSCTPNKRRNKFSTKITAKCAGVKFGKEYSTRVHTYDEAIAIMESLNKTSLRGHVFIEKVEDNGEKTFEHLDRTRDVRPITFLI